MASNENGSLENPRKDATGVSSKNCGPVPGPSGLNSKSPEFLQPFPKAGPRKKVGGRKKRYSAIRTSSPDKKKIMLKEKYEKERSEEYG